MNQGRLFSLLERCSHVNKFCEENRIERPLILGDSSSRHDSWVDEPGNHYGKSLIKICKKKCFIDNFIKGHTFVNRYFNGAVIVDSCLCDFTICKNLPGSFVAKDFEFFTGAGKCGQSPVCIILHVSKLKRNHSLRVDL